MRRLGYVSLICVTTMVVAALLPSQQTARAQGAQPAALVIEGGTLIDGNGGAPVRDVQIVVEGNKITRIGRKGQAPPAGARVVNADGKFIVPGLIDALVNYLWYQGEMYLNNGITSYVGIGDMGETGVVYAEAVKRGIIRAPRPIDWPVHFAGPAGNLTGLESVFDSPHPLRGPEEAREMTRRNLALGGYGISFQNGNVLPETFMAAVEVAHAAGKPVGIRAGGRGLGAKESSLMGADFIPRSNGVGQAVASVAAEDPVPGIPAQQNELELWANMDEAKAADLIKVLVQQKTALIPAFNQKAPGLPKGWPRFEAQSRRIFADPFLATYYPTGRYQTILFNFLDPPNLQPDVVDARRKGYQNALRFHRMLIEAGGRVLAGTDGGNFSMPGIGLLHEMQTFVDDMGLKPMQVLQSATKWPAEAMRMQSQIGTVEAGKMADILIVNADPLLDIQNLQKIAVVVADGRVVDLKYHGDYWSPFQGDGPITLPVVDDINWAVNIKQNFLQGPGANPVPGVNQARGAGAGGDQAQQGGARGGGGGRGGRGADPALLAARLKALEDPLPAGIGAGRPPQPTIETIDSGRRDFADVDFSKTVVKEGGPTLTVKLTGFNYFQRSQAYFNGVPVPTKVNNRISLEVTIDERLLRSPGRYPLVVKNLSTADPANPAIGNGTSNPAWLIVGFK
ncbi:MAG: amidohydrolase family protein [Acidobacteriota bacterium]